MIDREDSLYWKTVIDSISDGLMIVDPHGRIVAVNKAMEGITGYRKSELLGQSCMTLDCDVCPSVRAGGKDKYCALFKQGRIGRHKISLRKKDGTLTYVYKNAVVLKDSTGNVIGGVGTFTDLSEMVAKDQVITRLRRELSGKDGFHGILGKSPAMCKVFDLISSAAQSEAPVSQEGGGQGQNTRGCQYASFAHDDAAVVQRGMRVEYGQQQFDRIIRV